MVEFFLTFLMAYSNISFEWKPKIPWLFLFTQVMEMRRDRLIIRLLYMKKSAHVVKMKNYIGKYVKKKRLKNFEYGIIYE